MTTLKEKQLVNIVWLRRDLRLDDIEHGGGEYRREGVESNLNGFAAAAIPATK